LRARAPCRGMHGLEQSRPSRCLMMYGLPCTLGSMDSDCVHRHPRADRLSLCRRAHPAVRLALARRALARRHPRNPNGQKYLGRCAAADAPLGQAGWLSKRMRSAILQLRNFNRRCFPRIASFPANYWRKLGIGIAVASMDESSVPMGWRPICRCKCPIRSPRRSHMVKIICRIDNSFPRNL